MTDHSKDDKRGFLSDLTPEDFAKGMAQLPKLADMLRLAGLQDGRTMSGVKITSARMQALRAKAIGDPRAEKLAKRAEAHATRLAGAMQREEARVRPDESVLGPLMGLAGKFRLVGKVMDKSGAPVPNARVEISGKNTGVMFTAITDENGIYDLKIPVGTTPDKADDGEPIEGKIEKDGAILQAALGGLIKDGGILQKILTMPLMETLGDLAMPIASSGRGQAAKEVPEKSTKINDIQARPETVVKAKKGKAAAKKNGNLVKRPNQNLRD